VVRVGLALEIADGPPERIEVGAEAGEQEVEEFGAPALVELRIGLEQPGGERHPGGFALARQQRDRQRLELGAVGRSPARPAQPFDEAGLRHGRARG